MKLVSLILYTTFGRLYIKFIGRYPKYDHIFTIIVDFPRKRKKSQNKFIDMTIFHEKVTKSHSGMFVLWTKLVGNFKLSQALMKSEWMNFSTRLMQRSN